MMVWMFIVLILIGAAIEVSGLYAGITNPALYALSVYLVAIGAAGLILTLAFWLLRGY